MDAVTQQGTWTRAVVTKPSRSIITKPTTPFPFLHHTVIIYTTAISISFRLQYLRFCLSQARREPI
jgi:hypothetical protein